MRKTCAVLLWLAFASHAIAVSAQTSLCEADEINFSSCSIGEKVASFCASKNLSKKSGYLQYRFGKPNKLEFVFPAKRETPVGLFFNSQSPDGLEQRITFKNGRHTYIYFSIDSKIGASQGIYVLKDNSLIKTLPCSDSFFDQNPHPYAPYSVMKHEEFLYFKRAP